MEIKSIKIDLIRRGKGRWIRIRIEAKIGVDKLAEDQWGAIFCVILAANLMWDKNRQRTNIGEKTHLQLTLIIIFDLHHWTRWLRTNLVDIVDNSIHDLAFERFEYDSPIPSDKLCLTTSDKYHPFSNVYYIDDSNDIAELSRACSCERRRCALGTWCRLVMLPSTSAYSFFSKNSVIRGPKYEGCKRIVCDSSFYDDAKQL